MSRERDKCEKQVKREERSASLFFQHSSSRPSFGPSEKHPKKDAYSTESSPIVVVYVNGSFLTEVVPTHL